MDHRQNRTFACGAHHLEDGGIIQAQAAIVSGKYLDAGYASSWEVSDLLGDTLMEAGHVHVQAVVHANFWVS